MEVLEEGADVVENAEAIAQIEAELNAFHAMRQARPTGFAPDTLRDFEAKQKRQEDKQRETTPNFEDMLGNAPASFTRTSYLSSETRTFYPLPPKLSALSSLIAGVQGVGAGDLGEAYIVMQLSSTFLYTDAEEGAKKRPATVEEIEEFVDLSDLPMLQALNAKYLNVVMGGKHETKNG